MIRGVLSREGEMETKRNQCKQKVRLHQRISRKKLPASNRNRTENRSEYSTIQNEHTVKYLYIFQMYE